MVVSCWLLLLQPLQVLPLQVLLKRPCITLSSSTLKFGLVHPNAPKTLQLTLTNPTTVDAEWSFVDPTVKAQTSGRSQRSQQQQQQLGGQGVALLTSTSFGGQKPAGGSMRSSGGGLSTSGNMGGGQLQLPSLSRSTTAKDMIASSSSVKGSGSAAASEMHPPSTSSVTATKQIAGAGSEVLLKAREEQGSAAAFGQGFQIEPCSGVLKGRGLGLPKTQVVQVRFSPGHTRATEVQLEVEVKHGRGCGVVLQGQGTYQEGYGPVAVSKLGFTK